MGAVTDTRIIRQHWRITLAIAPVPGTKGVAREHRVGSERLAAIGAGTDFIGSWLHRSLSWLGGV